MSVTVVVQFLAKNKVAAVFLRKEVTPLLEETLFKEVSTNVGTASNGSRVWPRGNKDDKKIGIRIDWGQKFQDTSGKRFRNIVVQLNNDAESPAIKEEVRKNGSHEKRAIATLPLNDDGSALLPSLDKKTLNIQFTHKFNDGT